jgi:hypothetical protein
LAPGSHPTILSYHDSAVKIYDYKLLPWLQTFITFPVIRAQRDARVPDREAQE